MCRSSSAFFLTLSKNVKVKRRDLRPTLAEIFIPFFFVGMLVLLKTTIPNEESDAVLEFPVLSLFTDLPLMDTQQLLYTPKQDNALLNCVIQQQSSNLTEYFVGFESKDELESYYDAQPNRTFAAVEISNMTSFKIRMNGELVPDTATLMDSQWQTAIGQYWSNDYLSSGYMTIEMALYTAALSLQSNGSCSQAPELQVNVRQAPIPSYFTDIFHDTMVSIGAMYILIGFMPFSQKLLVLLVREKQEKRTEGLKMMGVSGFTVNAAWYATYLLVTTPSVLVIGIVASTVLFPNSSIILLTLACILLVQCLIFLTFALVPFLDQWKTAAAVSSLLLIFLYVWFYLVSDDIWQNALLSISPPVAFSLALQAAADAEAENSGITFSNMHGGSETVFPFWASLLMLTGDMLIYIFLGWYFDLVVPGEYGTHLRWNFCCTKSYWMARRYRQRAHTAAMAMGRTSTINNSITQEEEKQLLKHDQLMLDSEGATVGFENVQLPSSDAVVRIRGVSKVFDGVLQVTKDRGSPGGNVRKVSSVVNTDTALPTAALTDVNLTLYKGQITVLLGHNGAGKSTLINILTGFLEPSDGAVTVDVGSGLLDLRDHLDMIRQHTGVCAQGDLLWEHMTVREHAEYFAKLKHVPADTLQAKVDDMLADFNLLEKADDMADDLSGGQKRKLSIIIALIGNADIVYLDECTSGMDPHSRREVWRVLQEYKLRGNDPRNPRSKVVIVVTHFMDEADLLGDRIVVLNHGQIQCAGSSLFLKTHFGLGYHVHAALDAHADIKTSTAKLLAFVSSHVKSAVLGATKDDTVTITLPLNAAADFSDLFQALDHEHTKLGFASYGVGLTTLEEVFLALADENLHDAAVLNDHTAATDAAITAQHDAEHVQATIAEVRARARPSCCLQMRGMLWKKLNITKRNPRALFFQFGFPVLYILIYSIALKTDDTSSGSTTETPPSLHFPVAEYADSALSLGAVDIVSASWQLASLADTFAQIRDSAATTLTDFIPDLLAYADATPVEAMTSYGAVFATSTSNFTLVYNSSATHVLPMLLAELGNALLSNVSSQVMSMTNHPFAYTTDVDDIGFDLNGFLAAMMIGIAFSTIPVVYAINCIREREQGCTHIQRVMGVRPAAFWSGSLLFDYTCMLFCIIGLLVISVIFDNSFLLGDNFLSALILVLLYGLSATLFMYVTSFAFENPATAQGVLPLLCSLGPVGGLLLNVFVTGDLGNILSTTLSCVPQVALMTGLYDLAIADITRKYCIQNDPTEQTCTSTWDMFAYDEMGKLLLIMTVVCVVFFLLLIRLERPRKNTNAQSVPVWAENDDDDKVGDVDVYKEEERVQDPTGFLLRLLNLRKIYNPDVPAKAHVAVKNLNLGLEAGEFFGLLGPNGAGKTTTIKMLTGSESITSGEADIAGYSCVDDMQSIYSRCGFCPQFGGLFDEMTGIEHLQVYSAIKGIGPADERVLIEYYSEKFGLTEHLDKVVSAYSGGTKRKLALAIALLGHPSIVLLDEPSTGMDPGARRGMWDVLSSKEERKGRVFLLTTHVMEEAEALCSRLGIMVNGQLACLGSPAHLRARFGQGYRVEISFQDEKQTNDIEMFVASLDAKNTDNPQIIKRENECFAGRLCYQVGKEAMSLGNLFAAFEKAKQTYHINEYSVAETSLDQIFISFAREQQDTD